MSIWASQQPRFKCFFLFLTFTFPHCSKEVRFHYQKESLCRIIDDFSSGFQKSHFKSSLWFGCIKTTQNNSSTFLGTRRLKQHLRILSWSFISTPKENSKKELSHGVENTTSGWSTTWENRTLFFRILLFQSTATQTRKGCQSPGATVQGLLGGCRESWLGCIVVSLNWICVKSIG